MATIYRPFGECVLYQCNYTLLLIRRRKKNTDSKTLVANLTNILIVFFSSFFSPSIDKIVLVVAWIVEHMLTYGFANVTFCCRLYSLLLTKSTTNIKQTKTKYRHSRIWSHLPESNLNLLD